MDKIWNDRFDKKARIIYGIIGVLLVIVISFFFNSTFNQENSLDKYLVLCLYSVVMALGVEFIILIFNFKNTLVKSILLMFLGGYIVLNIYNDYIKTFSLFLIFSILIFIIIAFTKNIFSTFITFTMISIPFFVFAKVLLKMYPYNATFYLVLVAFFLVYRIIGEKTNKFFIGRCMGYKVEAEMYNPEQLKEQINFIYLIIFITLNLGNWFFDDNEMVATVLNNAFITGVAIANINWHSIFWFLKEVNQFKL